MHGRTLVTGFALLLSVAGCRGTTAVHDDAPKASETGVGNRPGGAGAGTPLTPKAGHALLAFAAGCFWGVEDGFRRVPGVTATAVGYTGGHTDDPTYETVCSHTTGHAEAVLVEYDPKVISTERLLRVFFAIHDPTQLDMQGPDVGDQYRSEVFVLDDAQLKLATEARDQAKSKWGAKVVTRISKLGRYWMAEGYHQQYAEKNGSHGCPVKLPANI